MPDADIALIAEAFASLLPARPWLPARLRAQAPALEAALRLLYGARADYRFHLGALAHAMAASLAARSPTLENLDRAREADPAWFLDGAMLGYSTYVDRFAGTLRGVAARVPYLRDLGVRYLHLLPFWRARQGDNDGGFAVADFLQVEPQLGSIGDVDDLAAALRGAGISLCADLVLNHTADDHPWAIAAKNGDPAYRAYYHVIADRAAVDAWEASLPQVFPQTAPGNFTHVPQIGGWVWTTFYPYQWDLNYANPAVLLEMAGVIMTLANRGVEAFRLDSAAFVWKRQGTACRSQPEAHALMRALRALVAIVAPAVLLKSEVIAPVADAAAYFGTTSAPECNLAYHAGLMTAGWAALAEQDAATVACVLHAAPALPEAAGWITYVRCHDDIGWQPLAPQATRTGAGETLDAAGVQRRLKRASDFFTDGDGFARGEAFQAGLGDAAHGINGTAASLAGLETAKTAAEEAAALGRLTLLYGLAYAAGGLPVINMGDELGQTNDVSYRTDPARRHEGRWLHRPAFDRQAEAAAAADPASHPARIRAALAGLAQARRRLPLLSAATRPIPLPSPHPALLAFSRGASTVILCSFSAAPMHLMLTGRWRDLRSDALYGATLDLPAYGMAWLVAADGGAEPINLLMANARPGGAETSPG